MDDTPQMVRGKKYIILSAASDYFGVSDISRKIAIQTNTTQSMID